MQLRERLGLKRVIEFLGWLFGGLGSFSTRSSTESVAKTLIERRDDYVRNLEKTAAEVEAKNTVLEEQLAFKKRVAEVVGRIQEAESRSQCLRERLVEYGFRKSHMRLRWWVFGGAFLILLLLLFVRC